MSRHNRLGLWGSLILTLVLAAWPAWAATPALTFGQSDVVSSGSNPGDPVYWFGNSRQAIRVATRSTLWFDSLTADGGGESHLDIGGDIPFKSFWVAVNGVTGEWKLATPDGYEIRQMAMPLSSLRTATSVDDELDIGLERADVLLVRPGSGAWVATMADGDANDRDAGLSSVFTLGFNDFTPAFRDEVARQSAPASPSAAAAGDLIFVIDPIGMILFTGTVQ